MRYATLGYRLPRVIAAPLFGDRRQHGLVVQPNDPDWAEWLRVMPQVYQATQRQSVGKIVNDAGYRVMGAIDLTGRTVLEIGPGSFAHMPWWRGKPAKYVVADIDEAFLRTAVGKLEAAGVPHERQLLDRGALGSDWPFPAESFDTVVSFYSLEHLYPLEPYLNNIHRVLRPGGVLVGGIPTEGGVAWGLGRFLTSRRWVHRHTEVDLDKIICWEHPNYADDILRRLDAMFTREHQFFWPMGIPLIDMNLVVRFVYRRN
jgi:SAM-dependent methyltransferase